MSLSAAAGAVYHGGKELTELIVHACVRARRRRLRHAPRRGCGTRGVRAYRFSCFALSNPLHPDLFPSVRKMEAEVLSSAPAAPRQLRVRGCLCFCVYM